MREILSNFVYRVLHLIKTFLLFVTFRDRRRNRINNKNRARLENTDFTLLASNCTGGVMSHDLGVKFNSQFVNLWIRPRHFIQYLSKLDYYNSFDSMEFLPDDKKQCKYPVGMLDGMVIHFVHYKSNEEAMEKWNERKKRINKDNIFVVMSERDGCRMEDLEAFDKLPFKNKVVFTKKPYSNIKSGFYVPGFEEKREIAVMMGFINLISAKRYFDIFPYVDWFNGNYTVEQKEGQQ